MSDDSRVHCQTVLKSSDMSNVTDGFREACTVMIAHSGILLEFTLRLLYRDCSFIKQKNTYALKTPHVVAPPFIYGVESLLVTDDEDLQSAREATSLVFMPSYTLLGI